jgi:hypothetical protein
LRPWLRSTDGALVSKLPIGGEDLFHRHPDLASLDPGRDHQADLWRPGPLVARLGFSVPAKALQPRHVSAGSCLQSLAYPRANLGGAGLPALNGADSDAEVAGELRSCELSRFAQRFKGFMAFPRPSASGPAELSHPSSLTNEMHSAVVHALNGHRAFAQIWLVG